MLIETSLIAKVVIILAPQLLIMLGIPIYIVLKARKAVFANRRVLGLKFREAYNLDRQLDIAIDWDDNFTIKTFVNVTFIFTAFWFGAGATQIFGAGVAINIFMMTTTSMLFGIYLSYILLWLDENDGIQALITFLAILMSAICIPIFIEFNFSSSYLFATLTILTLVLLLLEICRGFFLMPFSRDGNKFITWFGVTIFSLWLLWDVDFLLNQSKKINDWNSATQIAYFLYVDIVNLILYLVEAYAE